MVVASMTKAPPAAVQAMVENIRVPRGAGGAADGGGAGPGDKTRDGRGKTR